MHHAPNNLKVLLTLLLSLSFLVGCSEGGNTTPDPNTPDDPAAPTATFSADPVSGSAPLPVTFDASDSSAPGEIESYTWDFGDGAEGEGVNVQHTFETAGTYEVILTLTDLQGRTDDAVQEIEATAAGDEPDPDEPDPEDDPDDGPEPDEGLERLTVAPDGRTLQKGSEPFFWLGDTAWLLFSATEQEDLETYLDDAVAKGFNVVQVFLTAEWNGANGANLAGEAPFIDNDPTQFNPAYFDYAKQAIDAVAERGLYVALNYGEAVRGDVAYGVETSEEAYDYARKVGETFREQTLANKIIWVNGQDRNPDREPLTLETRVAAAEGLADGVNGEDSFDGQADYSTTLLSYHPDGNFRGQAWSSSTWFQDSAWLDFNIINTYRNYSSILPLLRADVQATLPKPTLCYEPSYEDSSFDGELRTDWHTRFQGYWCALSGSLGYAYGHDSGFRFTLSSSYPELLQSPGRGDMAFLKQVLTSQPLAGRVPDQGLIVSDMGSADIAKDYVAAARGEDGSYAFVYTTDGQSFDVALDKLNGSLSARWFDPREGTYQAAGDATGDVQTFNPPGEPGQGNDWLLILESEE